MKRDDFIKKIGTIGAASIILPCLQHCVHELPTPISVDFVLDLSTPAYSMLKDNGNFITINNIVIAKSNSGVFAAVTLVCSHQGLSEITYDSSRDIFSCNAHGAAFDLNGKGLNERGKHGLKTFHTSLNGNILRIFG